MIRLQNKLSKKKMKDGYVIWLTGISGSGKTTIGRMLYEHIKLNNNDPVEFIDGDSARRFFEDNLGYSKKDRVANIKRIVFACKLLSRNGIITIVSNIAPYYEIRDFIRKHLKHYCQAYIKASLKRCKNQDIKGLYKKAKAGKIKNVIGIDDVYEEPRNPDIVIDTDKETTEKSFKKIMKFLIRKKII